MTPWAAACLPCPPLSPGVYSNSCPLSHWCCLTTSSSVTASFCPQSFPASRPFPKSWLFTSGGQSTGASASTSVLPMNIQGWFHSGLTGLISLLSKELSRLFSSTTVWKHQFFGGQSSLWSNSHLYMTTGKTITLTILTFVSKVIPLLFNTQSRFFIAFLLRSKGFLISWLKSPSAVILESKKIKSVTVSIVSPSICHEVMGLDAMILIFWMLSFKPTFSLSTFVLIKRPFSSFLLLPLGWCHLHIWYFSRQS